MNFKSLPLCASLVLGISLVSFSNIASAQIQSETALTREARLEQAIKAGQLEEVRGLIADGADINQPSESGVSPLHVAVINNQDDIAEVLVLAGANVNVPDASTGASPLHLSALYGRTKIATLLIRKGANVNANMKFNISPLLVAAQFNHPELIELLLQHKADIHHMDQDGFTALHLAAQNGDDITAKLLLKHGANPQARDKSHNATPLMIATEQNHMNVVQLLQEMNVSN